jgi:hypothetical protein
MKLRKIAALLALAGAATIGTSAQAAATITNVDGVLSPFGGFDWSSGSAAWTSGFVPVVGSTFTLYYAGWAVALTDTGSGTLFTPHLDTNANGLPVAPGAYEYTILGTLQETITSCNASFTVCEFQITGGSYDIYYDTAANARQSNGTGFLDGTKIISGTVGSTSNVFDTQTGGQATLNGTVNYTNAAYINPALVGTTFTSTLQLASAVTNFTVPTGFDFDNNGSSDALGQPGVIVFQADANQTFTTAVPEPGMLLLAGLGLAACGAFSRRRQAK